jgi:hypothetical protein
MTDEDRKNWALILTPAGEEWSGRARYAAAMYFYRKNEMSAEVLEIYRICSRIDHEDAVDALRAYKMGDAWIRKVEARRAQFVKEAER